MMSSSAGGYTTRQVARLLGIPDYCVRGYVYSGLVFPDRGRRREYRYSFQDLVVLRKAVELSRRLPVRKVRKALRSIRSGLPRGHSLSTIHITTRAGEVVVCAENSLCNADGQLVLDFESSPMAAAPLTPIGSRQACQARPDPEADSWFELGCRLESADPQEAVVAYRRALQQEPGHADAHINLGRLLHQQGRLAEAVSHYREALRARSGDTTAAFNLGVALEDLGNPEEAVKAYRVVLRADDSFADAHFNLWRLLEIEGRPQDALLHLDAYHRLTRCEA